uniref:aspartate--tRNA ligase n=1 Tax=Chromera velia CCMP2878 TaxID=1169474 RepID=A0A0G4GC04_9ALVE|eukprot:Cvel_4486.t1-p1 / transcript=Cvel_4486.t1 / gene=Cvel_4486 / organism=Chromera_velia_CCMP2878 / gene_product=Aspartate--tRNA ligase, cytoplasmic, putative / transcript_product=Aspartate--tRNA ligase, cytoplasmic, putative / location=Cvel_scaffold196:59835-65393(-) / protein_length=561 / sequence_SO=supercontig / SO=protein_coding / is_pseudo=false
MSEPGPSDPSKAAAPSNADLTAEEKELRKQQKKAEKERQKAEKEAAKAARQAEQQASAGPAYDALTPTFGLLKLINSATRSEKTWTNLQDISPAMEGKEICVRARLQTLRGKGKLCFWVLRQQMFTIQAVISVTGDGDSDAEGSVSKNMVKWCMGQVPPESIVDVMGVVTVPASPVEATTQSTVEIQVKKAFCVSRAASVLPFQLEDANRKETEEDAKDTTIIRVNQDTRLNNRILDLRTLANQAIFRVSSMTCLLFREFLIKEGFVEIHSPKLIGGASEGGAGVFTLDYFGSSACLAQSPQLYKQMVLSGDMDRVFEIGPVFRAEQHNTYRHLCEFTGLDMEMTFKEHYFEVLDLLDNMFKYIFKGLAERCKVEVETVHKQYPAEPFQWVEDTPRLNFIDGTRFLFEKGVEGVPNPDDTAAMADYDISTEQERKLGAIIREKYGTDFYMMTRYPLNVRPFYSMPCPDDPTYANSYDFFMRGNEIVSGAQRIHDPEYLKERAEAKGIEVETIKDYIDAFRLGAYPHAGCGVGLERVVMLFLGLNNIRKSSLFPRDPSRLAP